MNTNGHDDPYRVPDAASVEVVQSPAMPRWANWLNLLYLAVIALAFVVGTRDGVDRYDFVGLSLLTTPALAWGASFLTPRTAGRRLLRVLAWTGPLVLAMLAVGAAAGGRASALLAVAAAVVWSLLGLNHLAIKAADAARGADSLRM